MYSMTSHPQKKHLAIVYNVIAIVAIVFGAIYVSYSSAVTTDTTLWITAGVFSFSKDITIDMSSYFWHPANTSGSINIGSYAASATAISAQSSGDHRFTVSDLLWASFTVTLQSSTLTASGVAMPIPAANITYTGSERLGTGYALTATGTQDTALNAPVTFVARTNASGLSLYAQEITLKVLVPGSSAAGSYTGVLTFTY